MFRGKGRTAGMGGSARIFWALSWDAVVSTSEHRENTAFFSHFSFLGLYGWGIALVMSLGL